MNTRGLPGTLAPMYQELACDMSVKSATSATCATQASCASSVSAPCCAGRARAGAPMASVIQSTCCSIDTTMLLNTDGLPGAGDEEQVGEAGDGRCPR